MISFLNFKYLPTFIVTELFNLIVGMRMMWGNEDGINKAWLGRKPYVFLSKASTVEPILGSSRHIDKSCDYHFLQPWLGTGLLTGSGNMKIK